MAHSSPSFQQEPPNADNRSRFETFINRINRRQWESLGESVQPRISYNRQDLSLSDFTQLLKQEFDPNENITVSIVTAVGGDADTQGPVAARLCVKTLAAEHSSLPSATRQHAEYARHMFAFFSDNKLSQLYDMSDHSQTFATMPPPSLWAPLALRTSADMRQFYADYLACANSEQIAEELQKFCAPGVVWNGVVITVQQYAEIVRNTQEATSGLVFNLHTLIVDKDRQQLAARIELTGTLDKPHAGGAPNEEQVAFAEHVFYWLEQGKITHVLITKGWEGGV